MGLEQNAIAGLATSKGVIAIAQISNRLIVGTLCHQWPSGTGRIVCPAASPVNAATSDACSAASRNSVRPQRPRQARPRLWFRGLAARARHPIVLGFEPNGARCPVSHRALTGDFGPRAWRGHPAFRSGESGQPAGLRQVIPYWRPLGAPPRTRRRPRHSALRFQAWSPSLVFLCSHSAARRFLPAAPRDGSPLPPSSTS